MSDCAVLQCDCQRHLLGTRRSETHYNSRRQDSAPTEEHTVDPNELRVSRASTPTARHLRHIGRPGRLGRIHERMYHYQPPVPVVRRRTTCRERKVMNCRQNYNFIIIFNLLPTSTRNVGLRDVGWNSPQNLSGRKFPHVHNSAARREPPWLVTGTGAESPCRLRSPRT